MDQSFDPVRQLTASASLLNAICEPDPACKPFYDMLSGGLIWRDEIPKEAHLTIQAMRTLWAYRASLMLSKPRDKLASFWNLGLSHFPNWVGFRQDRRMPTDELLAIYREGEINLLQCLRKLDRTSLSDDSMTTSKQSRGSTRYDCTRDDFARTVHWPASTGSLVLRNRRGGCSNRRGVGG